MTRTEVLRLIRSRCIEDGDCWLWQGATDGHGRPQMRHKGERVYVRRVAREASDGKPIPEGLCAAAKCGNPGCVSPHCSVVTNQKGRAKLAVERGAFRHPDRMLRMAMTKRAKSRYSEDLIAQVRLAPPPCTRIAQETGVSLSHVKAIRSGAARREYNSPFAGLGARA